jgi:hypothetical protein
VQILPEQFCLLRVQESATHLLVSAAFDLQDGTAEPLPG